MSCTEHTVITQRVCHVCCSGNTVLIWHRSLCHCKLEAFGVTAELVVCSCVNAGFRCENYQKQQSADGSRTQRVLSEASERLLSEFALRHGIVCITLLTVTF